MKRAPVYSTRGKPAPDPSIVDDDEQDDAKPTVALKTRLAAIYRRREPLILFFASLAIAGGAAFAYLSLQKVQREYTQEDIDSAVMHTMDTKTLPSRAAKAAELIRQSVVRVNGYEDDAPRSVVRDEHKDARDRAADPKGAKLPRDPEAAPNQSRAKDVPRNGKDSKAHDKSTDDKQARRADDPTHPEEEKRVGRVGSGVVIVDNGIILTNLHVVAGARRLTVTFYDGMESEAEVVAAQPENDLAVIRAKKLPDDLPAATLGSSARLQPGDDVVAVGFPFGIGPSVSAGVVSGLNRGFRSADGKRQLSRLIQFDAAVNPGNSGGPLITMDGEVVGIVTAIFNPTEHRTFIGIGFAATIESAGTAVGIPPF
jgi:S1-C subfamily serine protease